MNEHYYLVGYRENGRQQLALQINEQPFRLQGNVADYEWLMQNVAAADLLTTLLAAKGNALSLTADQHSFPANQQEVWASGVTYKRSEEARERESDHSTVYTRVYHAERPEIFMKSLGYAVVSQGQAVGIRADATWSVPEPELTVALNAQLEVIGFTIGNDMSSRDIEGENPLYLPQAKVYDAACALGPRIWLQPNCAEWPELTIEITIVRHGETVFQGETSTTNIKRSLNTLVTYLGRCKSFPYGAFLMSGTGVVPPDEFTLAVGDEVRIGIEPMGELVNRVKVVGGA